MNAVQTTRAQAVRRYPNAASHRYFLDKLTDLLLSAAICVGVVAILFFLVTLF